MIWSRKPWIRPYLISAIILILSSGRLWAQPPEPPPFVEVTETAGIDSRRASKDGEKVTGQAWGDTNGDGWLDLYLTDTDGPNTLYRNNGDGTFSLSEFNAQVTLPDALSGGATFADYDNDGRADLYVLNWGANALFHNEGANGFRDVTQEAGVGDSSNGKTASWGDYDSDGFLDLYVANWACVPKCGRAYEGDKDRLYHNNGDGTFSDTTKLLPGGKTRGAGFVASFVDYDNDGDLDIYLVNDEFVNPVGNALWRNDGPGCDGWCFTEVSEEANADTKVMGMGLATADYDRDGDLDFFFSNAGPMTLLQNQGDGTFSDVAEASGVQFPQGVGWGSVFFDYDNDGWLDLYLALLQGGSGGRPPNPLFHNNSDGTFTNMAFDSGAGNIGRSIGVAYADYDRDGWVDLVVGNYDEGYHLYRNTLGDTSSSNWLTLKLEGDGPVNRDAVGARVWLTDSHGRTQLQEVKNGSSLGSGNTLALHFGLGRAKASLVEIRWPDGTMQRIENVPINQEHEIIYGRDLTFKQTIPPVTAVWLLAAFIGLALAGVWSFKRRRWPILNIALLIFLAACSQPPSLAVVPPPTAVPPSAATNLPTVTPTSLPIINSTADASPVQPGQPIASPTIQPTTSAAAPPQSDATTIPVANTLPAQTSQPTVTPTRQPANTATTEPQGAPATPTSIPIATPTPIPTPDFINPVDETMQADADNRQIRFALLDKTNTGIWQYADNSFLHPIALAIGGDTAYMVDGGRVLAFNLQDAAPPQLLLAPGDVIEGVTVLEPYDVALSDSQLIVLDRTADVYSYDLSSQTWAVERYERPVGATSSHYYVALTTNQATNDRILLETSYRYVLAYKPGEPERIFLPDDARAVDVSTLDGRFYLLAQEAYADTAVATLYINGNKIYRFAPNIDIVQPRQIWAAGPVVYLLDSNGRRLLSLNPNRGYVQKITQLPPDVTAFAIDPVSGALLLAGKERLYFPDQPDRWQTISGGPTLPDPQPHDPDWLANLPQMLVPIQGSGLPSRDLQLPGAPRHYRLGIHEGADFYWQPGTQVRAAASGVVIRANRDYQPPSEAVYQQRRAQIEALGYTPEELVDAYRGMQIWIQHDNGLVSRYVHLSAIYPEIEEGGNVAQGQLIGEVGNTGSPSARINDSEDAHLHFELRRGEHYLGQYLRPIETRELFAALFSVQE